MNPCLHRDHTRQGASCNRVHDRGAHEGPSHTLPHPQALTDMTGAGSCHTISEQYMEGPGKICDPAETVILEALLVATNRGLSVFRNRPISGHYLRQRERPGWPSRQDRRSSSVTRDNKTASARSRRPMNAAP